MRVFFPRIRFQDAQESSDYEYSRSIKLGDDEILKYNTRMHSSRMRTASLLTVSHSVRGGGLAQPPHPRCRPPGCRSPPTDADPLDANTPWMQTPYGRPPGGRPFSLDADPLWMQTPWTQTPFSLDAEPPSPWMQRPPSPWMQTPRMQIPRPYDL